MRTFNLKPLAAAFAMLVAAATFMVPTTASAQDWTGFYAGVHGDYLGSSIEYENAGTPHQAFHGAMLGAQLGYDYQFNNNVVLGAVADISLGDVNTGPIRDGNYIVESGKISQAGSIRARAGYAIDAFLPYITAGYAWNKLEQTESCPLAAAVPFGFCHSHGGANGFNASQTKTQTGWVIGGGVQYAIADHWSIGLDYLHAMFGGTTFNLGDDGIGTPLPPSTVKNNNSDTFRVAVNYRF